MTVRHPATIAEYIEAAPSAGQPHLRKIYAILKRVAPEAQEAIKWGTPFFVEPRFLFAFSAHKAHLNFAPPEACLAAFREELQAYAYERLTPDDLIPELHYDLDLRIPEANASLHQLLRHFGPYGVGNPSPVFIARDVGVVGFPREVGDGHAKLELTQDGARLQAIGFRMAARLREIDFSRQKIDVAFQLQVDRWNGSEYLQARLLDVRPASP